MLDRLPLEIRTVNFSRDIIRFCKTEPKTTISSPIISQLIRSATSIGANHAEARNAASKTDFRNKITIAKKEAAETEYWLTILTDIVVDKAQCQKLLEECHYLLMILQKSVVTVSGSRSAVNVR